jgi:hypothetical protein
MSTVQLRRALEERPNPGDKPIVTRSMLQSCNDFYGTCLKDQRVIQRGWMQLKVDGDLFETCLSKESDFKKSDVTQFALQIQKDDLGQGMLGCNRLTLGRTKVGTVIGDCDYTIGDVLITKFVKRKNYSEFFNFRSLNSPNNLFSKVRVYMFPLSI